MNITEFGKVVRKARVDAQVSLLEMANEMGVSSAYLSGLETGRRKVPDEWVEKICEFFGKRKISVLELREAADVSNKSVSLEGLSPAHQLLVAGFARRSFAADDLEKFKALLASASTEGKD